MSAPSAHRACYRENPLLHRKVGLSVGTGALGRALKEPLDLGHMATVELFFKTVPLEKRFEDEEPDGIGELKVSPQRNLVRMCGEKFIGDLPIGLVGRASCRERV